MEKYHKNIDFLNPDNPSAEQAYFLGWLVTDGYIQRNSKKIPNLIAFDLAADDENFTLLTHLKSNLCPSTPIQNHNHRKYNYSDGKSRKVSVGYRLEICGQELAKYVCCTWGIEPNKTGKEEFCTIADKIPKEFHPHLLRGITEGDGCFYIGGNNIKLSLLGNEKFLHEIKNYLINNKITESHIGIHKKSNANIFEMQVGSYSGINDIGSFIYSGGGYRLERKYKKFQEICKTKSV